MRLIYKKLQMIKLNKKTIFAAAVLTVLFLCAVFPAFAAPEKPGDEVLTVGVPIDRCPVFYRDRETNHIAGIGTDLMEIAAKEAGYTVEFKAVEEESLKEALDNTEYDVVLPFGSTVLSKEGKPAIVSDNLFQTPFTLVTVNNRKLPPLKKLRIGMLHSLAGGAETVSRLYPGVSITFYETMDDSVKALRKCEVDALLHNSYVWSYVLQKPSYEDLSVQPSTMFSMDFRAGTLDTPKGRRVIERLNGGIAKISDTKRRAVILDYTSRRLYENDFYDYLYENGTFLLLIGLLIILVITVAVLKARTYRFMQDARMRRMTDYDLLTRVLNLNGFRKKVEEKLRANPDTQYVLCYTNIKNFKFINESLGMEKGDELLCFWADVAAKNLDTDKDVFGRVETDHFVALRHFVGDEQYKDDVKNVLGPVQNYFINRGSELRVQICMGVYFLTPEDSRNINVDRMLDYARMAEKKLRSENREGIGFYNERQWQIGRLITEVTGRLPIAIKHGEIQVWYQPQVEFKSGNIIGAEALCRWNTAKHGFIPPSEFIPALEETGLIYELDRYVWETVCKDLKRWNEQGKHRKVSINLSRADFAKARDIPEHFKNLVQTHGLSPEQLHIEITETAYVDNPELLISTTQKLREYGFCVEMDDFGSGYSSLNMLKEVQVDRIKLDLRFLTETGDHERGRIIIGHIIKMAHSLGMEIIAEGVEKEEQASFLNSLGCGEMQGFYYYKPMPTEEFERLIDENEG